MFRLTKFSLAQDRLGHPFSLSYEGSKTHKTWLGTGLSLVINILVLIILTQKIDAVFNMIDPEVQVNTRPIFKNEVAKTGLINLAKHKL